MDSNGLRYHYRRLAQAQMRCGSVQVIKINLSKMNKNKKDPPKVTIGVALRFKKSLQFRQIAMDLAIGANVNIVMRCMANHDEILISREATVHEISTAFRDVQSFTTMLLAAEAVVKIAAEEAVRSHEN